MYLHQLHKQGNNQFKFPLSFIFDLIENYVFIIQVLWTHFICNNNNIHVNILTDYTCSIAKYKNIQPWKKQLHTNSLHTFCELCTLQLILSLNDLLSMKYQISVCFIPPVMLFHFSSALLFSVLIIYLSQ